MIKKSWLLRVTFLVIVARKEVRCDENVSDAIRSLREQVNALLDHRQQDYNALEGSLKRAIEKNTELFVLKNEMKQLRKEMISLRGGNGNEAKNERLRVRWLGSAVTELRGEVAEVLRTRNASEELAERSRMKGEFALLKGDVAAAGRGIRNVGGRIAKLEAVLGMIRVDIAAVKERFSLLSRSCADIASQLNSIQIEVKSVRCCDSCPGCAANLAIEREDGGEESDGERRRMLAAEATIKASSLLNGGVRKESDRKDRGVAEHGIVRRRFTRRHGYSRRNEGHRARAVDERLRNVERKISVSTQGRIALEKRVASYENEWSSLRERVKSLEKGQVELSGKIGNVSENAILTRNIGESTYSQLIGSVRALEEAIETSNSSGKRELVRLGVDAARKAAELSLTREELSNVRRTVQALSVSASKLQERSDRQEEAVERLINDNRLNRPAVGFHRFPSARPSSHPPSRVSLNDKEAIKRMEQLDDRYHLIGNNLTGDCDSASGLRLLQGPSAGSRPMLVFCREGWTVVARRIDGTVDFDRGWDEYSLGFGSPVSEYWIGNEILHELTRDNCSSLRIDMLDIYGKRWRAEYKSFTVDSEETGYRLRVSDYAGNVSDALSYQNGMAFSAKDRDMDVSATHCAKNYHGGWWFSRCQHANLNGKYSLGLTWFRSDTDQWMSIAFSEMSVRRKPNCRSR